MGLVDRSSALTRRLEFLLMAWFGVACLADAAAAQALEVVETDKVILVRRVAGHGAREIVTYNKVSPPTPDGIDSVYDRSGCLHPVNSPAGRTVTQMFPVDHPHQHGIFSAWVKTTYDGGPVDF